MELKVVYETIERSYALRVTISSIFYRTILFDVVYIFRNNTMKLATENDLR